VTGGRRRQGVGGAERKEVSLSRQKLAKCCGGGAQRGSGESQARKRRNA